MNNQAVIDIEQYYSMRKMNEEYEKRVKELEKERAKCEEEMRLLKISLITIVTNAGIGSIEPPYLISYKDEKLIVKLRSNIEINDRVKDVIVLI